MPTPDEMTLGQVLELLTPIQQQSVLVHARQLAKANLAVALGGSARIRCEVCRATVKPNRLASHMQKAHNKYTSGQARRMCGACKIIVDADLYDQHLKEEHGSIPNLALSSDTAVAPDGFENQKPDAPKNLPPGTATAAAPYPPGWFIDGRKRSSTGEPSRQATVKGTTQSARAHPTPPSKPPIKPPKKRKKKIKGAKNNGKKTQQSKKSRFRPRLLQGGLCNPR